MPQDRENVAPNPPQDRTGPIGFSRLIHHRTDGAVEIRDRWMYKGKPTAPEPDLSTPTPSCDAPSCDCAEGEDCKANGAAVSKCPHGIPGDCMEGEDCEAHRPCDCGDSDDCRLDVNTRWRPEGCKSWIDGVEDRPQGSRKVEDVRTQFSVSGIEGIQRSFDDLNRAIKEASLDLLRAKAKANQPGPRHLLVTIDGNDLRIEEGIDLHKVDGTTQKSVYTYVQDGTRLTLLKDGVPCADVPPDLVPILPLPPGMDVRAPTIHPDLAARLDGLSAKLDALAERKGGKDGKGKDLTVRIVKVSHAHKVSGRGLIWVVEHDDSIHPGTLVCSSNGSLGGRVMEVTGIDATSRPGQPVGLLVKPVKA